MRKIQKWVRRGEHGKAYALIQKRLARSPKDKSLRDIAGELAMSLGRTDEELEHRRVMARLEPTPTMLLHLAKAYVRAERWKEASSTWLEVARALPDDVQATHAVAVCAYELGRFAEAEEHWLRATELAPNDAGLWAKLGNARVQQRKSQAALVAYRRSLELDVTQPEVWFCRGNAAFATKELEVAISSFEQAIALRPDFAAAHANLAGAHRIARRPDEARYHAELALESDAGCRQAELELAALDEAEGDHDSAERRLSALATQPGAHGARAKVAWAKVLDKLGQHARAFEMMREGQATLARTPGALDVDRSAWPKRLARIRSWVDEGAKGPALAPDGARDPIFLVGFPRSGTTLMEQVLAAHPEVETLGEHAIVDAIVESLPGAARYPHNVPHLDASTLDVARRRYRELAARQAGGAEALAGKALVDKLPLNIVHAPLLTKLFPKAHFLVMLRDPRDCVVSGFFQDMVVNEAMIHFHCPEDLATFYADVMKTWCAIRDVDGLHYREQRYEDLVKATEEQVRAVLDFLGLPFAEACLRYHDKAKERAIYTPSYQDVTKPIFNRSLARWRNYAQELEPTKAQLAPYIEAHGYPPWDAERSAA